MIGVIPNLLILQSYFTVSQLVNKYLKNNYLRKAFSIHPLLVGGDPHTTTSIYALIHYLERKWGVFFCMGGTGKIVSELKNTLTLLSCVCVCIEHPLGSQRVECDVTPPAILYNAAAFSHSSLLSIYFLHLPILCTVGRFLTPSPGLHGIVPMHISSDVAPLYFPLRKVVYGLSNGHFVHCFRFLPSTL